MLTGVAWGGADLAIGDFDGDGNLDRLRTVALSTSPEVWSVDTKSSTVAGTAEDWRVTRSGGVPTGMPSANQVLVGDFNGDGRDDLLWKAGSSTWYIIQSRASSTSADYQGEFLISAWSSLSTAGVWSTPIVGDFDGDGRDDLATFDATNPSNKLWSVARSTGTTFEPPTPENAWAQTTITPVSSSIVAGDFNGDGRDDLLFRKSDTGNWAIAVSDGSRFNVMDPAIAVSTNWATGRKGDFDGDGADELLGWNSSANRWETVRYNDHRGMSLDVSWGSALGSVVGSQNTHVGDANRDGRDDLVVFNTSTNQWQVARSQRLANGTNSFVLNTIEANGTNDWHRWFDDWDWGPTGQSYRFLNVDAPYQKFLDIFSDVYNTVELELYPGLMKGIEATAQTKAGNDWDQAALLVERLEPDVVGQNEGQRARIATGKVRVDPAIVREWIGTTTNAAAFKAIAASLDRNADTVDGKYRFTHAWVQALLPTVDGLQWIDVDPSWKLKDRQAGEAVVLTNVNTGYTPIAGRNQRGTFDEFGYLAHAGANQLPLEWYEDQLMRFLADSGKNKSLADVAYDGPIIQKQFNLVAMTWNSGVTVDNPATVTPVANFAAIAASPSLSAQFTHQVAISIEKAGDVHLTHSLVVPKHSLDAINITYAKPSASTYSARLIVTPSTGIATTIAALAGKTFNASDQVTLKISHSGPTALQAENPNPITYYRKPGQIHTLGLDANQYSNQHIVGLQAGLNNALADGASVADIDDLLNYTAAKYWYDLNRNNRTIDGLLRTVGGEQWVGSGVLTSDPYLLTDSIPGFNGGVPRYTSQDLAHLQFPILPYNMGVDLPNSNHVSFDIGTGDVNDEAFQLVGYNASALENAILEEVVNSRSISTIRGLLDTLKDSSNSTGTWVFESIWDTNSNSRKFYRRGLITESSSTTTYNPNGGTQYTAAELRTSTSAGLKAVHSDSVVEGIVSLLENSGSQERVVVLVPNQKSIVETWSGSVYVAEFKDVQGSHGAYIIAPDGGTPSSGGYSGNARKIENKSLPPATHLNQTFAGDPVNVANGNMFRDEVDFTFANPIIPLDFARHYDTQNKLDVGFGVGWVHSFTGFIYQEQDPANSSDVDYVWLRGTGERHTFEDLNFSLPNTLFGDVETTGAAGNKRLTAFEDKNGLQYIFEPISSPFVDPTTQKSIYGRLIAIKDATGSQGVNITYESATSIRVAKVSSISTPSRRLEFTYNANNTIDVKRYETQSIQPLNTWVYVLVTNAAYSGKRLGQVKHANSGLSFTNYWYYDDGPASRRGLIKKIIEPNQESHTYEYYSNGRVFRVTDGAGNQQSFNYNLFRNLTEFTDENGNVETYIHQDNGLLTKQIHNDRSRLEFTWGPQSSGGTVQWEEFLMRSSTDERGAREAFEYYAFSPANATQRPGELYLHTANDGVQTKYTYKSHDYISAVEKIERLPLGSATWSTQSEFTYDVFGHVLTEKNAEGQTTAYEYFDSTAPAHLRGLRKSATQPKGVSGQAVAPWETSEAVTWEVLHDGFSITGNALSVRLKKGDEQKVLFADAVRIDRVDGNSTFTRIIDDNLSGGLAGTDPNFRLSSNDNGFVAGSTGHPIYGGDTTVIRGYGASLPGSNATWIFRDLEPGKYRVSAVWARGNDRDPTAIYELTNGLPGETSVTTVPKNQQIAPDDFRSYQTVFEYDTAGNATRAITEGLPAGYRAYDAFGNVVYEEDATGVATIYSYDVLGRLIKSTVVDPTTVTFTANNVLRYHGTGGWDISQNSYAVLNGGDTLYLYDGARKGVAVNYNVTANTILEFDFEATGNLGEYQAIGVSHSLTQQVVKDFALAGTRYGDWPEISNWEYHGQQANTGKKHYRIPIGTHVSAGLYEYLAFINYDNGTAPTGPANQGQSYFSNVRLYEANDTSNVATTTYVYDASGRLISSTDALNRKTSYQYDISGRLVRTTFADGTFTTHQYDAFGNCIAVTDELDRTTRFVYDDRNRRIQTIYADGHSTRTRYDGAGQIAAEIDERGAVTSFKYDKAGRLVETTRTRQLAGEANATITQKNTYDALGRLVLSEDANQVKTRYTYDKLDRLIETRVLNKGETNPTSPTLPPISLSTIEYDTNGRIARTIVYDVPGLLQPTTSGGGGLNFASFNSYDQVVLLANSHPAFVQMVETRYDAFGRAVGVVNADATSTRTVYDHAGRLRFTFDELGRKTEYQYDQFGRLAKMIDPDPDGSGPIQSHYIRYIRKPSGEIETEWEYVGPNNGGDANHESPSWFVYDSRGRMVLHTQKYDWKKDRNVYDAAGQLVATIDANGNADFTTYDERGRVITHRLADPDGSGTGFAPVTKNQYDAVGNVIASTDPLGNTTWFEYDSLNRLRKESSYHTHIVDDVAGGSDTFSIGASSPAGVAYAANAQNVYGGDATVLPPAAGSPRFATWTFKSLDAGQYRMSLSSAMVTASPATTSIEILNGGLQTLASYSMSELSSTPRFDSVHSDVALSWIALPETWNVASSGTTLSIRVGIISPTGTVLADAVRFDRLVTTSYTYDKNGNLVTETDTRGYASTYSHDELNRRILAKTPDPDGNGSGNLPLETRTVYDGYGNTIESGANRGTTATNDDRTDTFKYDKRNRLIEQVVDAGTGRFNVTTKHAYDAVGNLIETIDAENTVTRYRYDGADRVIDKYQDYGQGSSAATSVTLGTYVPLNGYNGSATVISGNAVKIGQNGENVWGHIRLGNSSPTPYQATYRTVLEFSLTVENPPERLAIGFDTDSNVTVNDFSRIFDLGGINQAASSFLRDFRLAELAKGTYQFHIPIGEYLTDAEKASGILISHLILTSFDDRGLSTLDRGIATFSNLKLYESDEVRTVTTYDPVGNIKTVTEASDPRNIIHRYYYDRLGRQTSTRLDDGGAQQQVSTTHYDNIGNLLRVKTYHPNSEVRETGHEYDRLNRRTKTILPDPDGNPTTLNGLVTKFAYDVAGNLIAETNGENESTRFAYNELGLVVSETDGNGDETHYRYDSAGNLTSITDAEGNTTSYKYDGLGRVTEETNSFGTRYHRYNAAGQLERIIDRNEVSGNNATTPYRTRSFTYDTIDRKIQEVWRNGSGANSVTVSQQSWSYDNLNRVTKEVDGNGTYSNLADDIVNTYEYDGLGRLVEQRNYDPATFSTQGHQSGIPRVRQTYQYFYRNLSGTLVEDVVRRQYLVTASAMPALALTESRYNRIGQLYFQADSDLDYTSSTPAIGNKNLLFTYDTYGNLTRINRSDDLASYLNSYFTYDKADRLTEIRHDGEEWTLAKHSYTYDNASRVASFDTTGTGATTRGYSYDDDGQLTGESRGLFQFGETYKYDDNGNRIGLNWAEVGPNIEYTVGAGNRLLNDFTYSYTYDHEGNVLTRTRNSEATADDKVTEYTWDHHNRLTKVAWKNNSNVITQSINYTYDAQGRRVKRTHDANGAAAGGVSNETFVYDSQGSGGNGPSMLFNNVGQLEHRYLYGPAVDQVLADEYFGAGSGGSSSSQEVFWQLADQQGTVRDIGNSEGFLRKHVDYNAFGRVISEQSYLANGPAIPPGHAWAVEQLFYYQGQERDSATGLQQHGARWYDPDTGRWLSEDPLGFDGGDPNLYRFVGNSPTTYVDPTGTTQAGNPLASLNVSNGGYSGGKAAGPKIPNSAVASGFKAIGNSFLSAGMSLVNNVYSAGRNLANNYNEISRLYSQANTLTGQINAVANQRANPGWFGPSSSALNDQYNTLASQRLAVNANIENIITTSVFGGPRAELVSNPGGTQYNSVAGYAARGLGTGAKAVTNATVSTATIGYVNEAWTVNDFDRRIAAYDTANGFALVGTEIGGALITGGASRYARSGTALARLGKAAVAYDTAGNVVGVGSGINDAYNNGLGFSNSVQIIGSGLGLGGNVAAGSRALQEIASDATRLRVQPAGLYGGVPIPKVALAPKKGIYEFPDQLNDNVVYVGQSSNIPNRLKQHVSAGRLSPGTEATTAVSGSRTAREIAEHQRIQTLTGGVPARSSPNVSNKRDPIGPNRVYLLE